MKTNKSRLKAIWEQSQFSKNSNINLPSKQDMDGILARIFCPGPFYYYLFNFPLLEFIYVHPDAEKMLGVPAHELTLEKLASMIHADDLSHVQQCETLAGQFMNHVIAPERIKNYKVSYFLRFKTTNGRYKTILHQAITLVVDEHDNIHTTMGIQTDVTHWMTQPNRTISFIALDDDSKSYYGIDVNKSLGESLNAKQPRLTKRELEVLGYLAEGFTVKQISEIFVRSEHAVRTHRNNIRKKMDCRNTAQMVAKGIRMGWI
ncbi:MAG: LuxR C-terminal-related transcriptional regulator [Bacteroidota bacterium]